ncbi:mannose-6-phosphate isomerase, class I [Streptomyces sp. SID3343]|uniref:mannose-6-phosphate isomerase, class I n=1 Tax=Streptomyces sp. SID3343 TaxID=2690260 RepID=UPI00136A4308|nr:mannose-6-phosphate isomerase, class I [Streptomyces sp. SID3343]MYV97669.1 mannose-6-phosphate isomerase, class I [Streptomyces sp. SID3343]
MDRLLNRIRANAWGSLTAIPELLGVAPTGKPQAELWMGAHPGAPSEVDRGDGPRSLVDLIAENPDGELGADTAARFGPRLPFLLKVLAAAEPLSLQVHPDAVQARHGFAEEEARGVPIRAPHRNYRDSSHKPEMICAIGDFEGLVGYREISQTLKLLDALDVPQLAPFARALHNPNHEAALRAATTHVLMLPARLRTSVVDAVAAACRRLAANGSPYADACAAVADLAERHPGDPGVAVALLLNHIRLREGEAVFLAAGMPHSYLHGVVVEILANSDNVLRCGLTDKHIDVGELLRVMAFRAGPVEILTPEDHDGAGEEVYATPVPDFRLSRLRATAAERPYVLDTTGPQILLCVRGTATARERDGDDLVLARGQSVYIRAGEPPVSLTVVGDDALVFRAGVPFA